MKKFYLLILFISFSIQLAFSQEKWEPTNGPHSSNITSLVYDEKNNELFNVSCNYYDNSGYKIFKSTDMGSSWSKINLPIKIPFNTMHSYNEVGIIPSADDLIYAPCIVEGKRMLFRSTDRGQSWTRVNDINNSISRVLPDSKGNLYAYGSDSVNKAREIYLSTDKGNTFNLFIKEINGVKLYNPQITLNNNDDIYVRTWDTLSPDTSEIYFSKDKGKTWQNLMLPDSLKCRNNFFISSSGVIYVTAFVYPPGQCLTFSRDEGKTWSKPLFSWGFYDLGYINIKPWKDNIYMYFNDTLFRSTDNGISWNELNINNKHAIWYIRQFSDSGIIAKGDTKGSYTSSNNGQSWNIISNDYDDTVHCNDLFTRNNEVLFAGFYGAFYSSDNGDSWINVIDGTGQSERCYISSEGTLYILYNMPSSSIEYDLAYSTDKGKTWQTYNLESLTPIDDICENSKGEIYITISGDVLKGSKGNWNPVYKWAEIKDFNFSSLAAASNDDIYMMSDLGLFKINNQSGKIDTVALTSRLPKSEGTYNLVAVSSKDYIFIASGTTVCLSTDHGASWSQVYKGDTFNKISDILINKSYEIILRLANGVLVSNNEGKTWTRSNEGLPDNNILALALSDNGYAYCGFSSERIYRRNVFPTSVEELSPELKLESFAYPNPASDRVSISLPSGFSDQEVNIEVYDISGVLKLKLNSITASSGNNIQLDISTFDSGLYYAVIKSGANTIAEKLSVVR